MEISKKYIPVKGTEATHLEVSLFYDVGGLNVFTGRTEARGYYIRVVPVKRERGTVSFVAFSGTKTCIKQVARKSKKAEAEAVAASGPVERYMIAYVCNKNGLEVEK